MKRRTHKAIVNLAAFICLVLLVVVLGSHSANNKTFAWHTIVYKTRSASLPEARGICPGLASSYKPALIVARVTADGDPGWLDALNDQYHICIYTVDAVADPGSKHLQVPANRGHEAMAYLTFLIDNYAEFPAAGAVFVHGSRWAWHNDAPDYDNAGLLAALNVSRALEYGGYHNLRCDWSASTCEQAHSPPQGSLETTMNAALEPWNLRHVSDAALPYAIAALFGKSSAKSGASSALGRGDAVRSQCCAQFVVARDRVWQHSREEYVALRQWLLDGSVDGQMSSREVAPRDDRVAGRILSYLWHILFLEVPGASDEDGGVGLRQLNSLACPRAEECYCRLYGRCNLSGCIEPGSCHGQYRVPPNFRLPENWAATHS